MKKSITMAGRLVVLTMLFIFWANILPAQWNLNTSVNLQISTLTVADMQTVATTDGKTWIAFYTPNGSNYDMRAQLLDANGYKLLGTDGLLVSNQPSGSATYVFNVCVDASNNLIIACQDQRTGPMSAVMYKISEAGTQLWGSTGIVLGQGLAPYPAVLTTGETIVVWNESVSNTLNLQKITTTGTTAWGTPVQVFVGTTGTTRGQVIASLAGKFTMVYQKKGVGISTTLYAQQYDNSGNALYSALQISNLTSSGARYYSISAEGDTTYFGYYVSSGSRFNSYLQRINPGGTIPWGMNGSNFNTSVSSGDNYQMTTNINQTPGSPYVWSVCTFSNTSQTQYGVYIQKFLKTSGARQFTDLGKVVYAISSSTDQQIGGLCLVSDNPMFMSYDVNYVIYATRLDASGNFVWPGNRVVLSATTATLATPKGRFGFAADGPNRCVGTWYENRGTNYIGYAQGISIGGLIGIKVATQGNVAATITANGGTLQMVDTIFPSGANQSVTWSIVPGTGSATISITGLVTATSNGTVYAKAVAVQDVTVKDSLMITISGQLVLPAVTTIAATSVTSTTATLNGSVNANSSSTTVSFNWGLTIAYGNTVAAIPPTVTGNTVTAVLANLTGLLPNTTYHFRVVGVNAAGTSYGNDLTFTTSAVAPVVVTNAATSVASTTAQLNGTVTANNSATTVSFNWGLTVAYGNTISATPASVNGMTATAVLANLTGLVVNTTYHFRCVGVNSAGTTYGLDQTFTTVNCTPPVITISGPITACVASTGNIYTTQTGMTGYTWSISSGGIITAGAGTSSITVTWNTAGAQTVSVNYTNSGGCSAASPTVYNVTVNPLPVPTIAGPATVCAGVSGNVYSTQSGMTGYSWNISSGGTITAGAGTNAITVTWSSAGAQTVSVNYTNSNGCSAASPVVYNVTVNAAPSPTITGSTSLCVNSGYYNYTTQTGMTNYVWSVSSGGTITFGQGTSQVQVTWNSAGAQTISVNYSNANNCSAATPTVLNVTVNPLPGNAGNITGTPAVCGGATGIAYSVGPVANATTYVWTLPAGATIATGSGTNSITVDYAANASSGSITVVANNLCGNGNASPPFAVTVTPQAGAAGTITGEASVCQGSQGVVYTVAPIANATSYVWTIPTGATTVSGSGSNSITVDFGMNAQSGNITVYGANSCGNGNPSPNFAVTVNPTPPAPVITLTGDTLLTSSAPAGNQWYYDGVLIPGATGQTYAAITPGIHEYWCTVTLNGCTSDTSNHIFVIMEGVQNHAESQFQVFPVPNDGRFTLLLESTRLTKVTISVYNELGSMIYNIQDLDVQGRFEKTINLRPIADGVYLLMAQDCERKMIKRIMVRR